MIAAPITVLYNDRVARRLERLIRRMAYGDALIRHGWRLEYVRPDRGLVHYRLYRGNELVGIQYVRAASWLAEVQRGLAAYLSIVGFTPTNTRLRIGGSRTRLSAPTNRLPKLFIVDFDTDDPDEAEWN